MAAAYFRIGQETRIQDSRGGMTRESLRVFFSVADPRQRWIASRQPGMNPAFAIAEVVWIIRGRADSAFVNHWTPILPKFAGWGTTYHGAYGSRLRRHFNVDQLGRAYNCLRHEPDSRQIVLQMWDPAIDLPTDDGEPAAEDVPCNVCAILKVRDNRLEWTQIMRSNDFMLGFPHNVVQFTSLQEILAGWLGIEPGTYHHFSDSLHVYERDLDDLRRSVPIDTARNNDTLCLPKEESDKVFSELERRLTTMLSKDLELRDLEEMADFADAPIAYRNLIRIVAADDARRRGWSDIANHFVEECTNPALRQLWRQWSERVPISRRLR